MSSRLIVCLGAAAAILFLSGSIVLSSVNLDALQVGDVQVPGRWKASSPTVQSDAGEYLAYDVGGESPRVYFTKERGPHTAWAFVDREPYEHHSLQAQQGRPGWVSVDESGFTLRLRATEGPFRGWYLARTKEGDLVLVKKADRAAVVKFRLKEVTSR
jgi:hypothetical protein